MFALVDKEVFVPSPRLVGFAFLLGEFAAFFLGDSALVGDASFGGDCDLVILPDILFSFFQKKLFSSFTLSQCTKKLKPKSWTAKNCQNKVFAVLKNFCLEKKKIVSDCNKNFFQNIA